MRISLLFISAFVFNALIAEASLQNIQKHAALAAISGVSYFCDMHLKDFIEETLEAQVPSQNSKTFLYHNMKEMASTALVALTILGSKTVLWSYYKGTVDGSSDHITGPLWLEKAWNIGIILSLTHTAYVFAKKSLAPDIIQTIKNRYTTKKQFNPS